jgi:hypothetical protein
LAIDSGKVSFFSSASGATGVEATPLFEQRLRPFQPCPLEPDTTLEMQQAGNFTAHLFKRLQGNYGTRK